MAANLKRGLGKGLGALIAAEEKINNNNINNIIEVDINKIEPNHNQPRKYFNPENLEELAASIKEFGIIQPLIVNETKSEGCYTLVAGERRWRAARIAKLTKVPVIIKNYDEMETLQIALIENIQREDLNPIEEALCYQKLIDIFFFKQEDIANKIGKSRNTIGNMLSLLNLDLRVQNFIIEGRILIGHGRKLLEIKDKNVQFEIAEKIIENELSIKEAGELVERFLFAPAEKEKVHTAVQYANPQFKTIENTLKVILGTKVSIKDGKNKGKIEIEYYSQEELDRLIGMFNSIQ